MMSYILKSSKDQRRTVKTFVGETGRLLLPITLLVADGG